MVLTLTDAQLREPLDAGLSQREIARRTGLARSTVQDRIKRLGLQVSPPVQTPVSRPDTGAVQSTDTGSVSRVGTGADHDTAPVAERGSRSVESLAAEVYPG